MRYLHFGTEWIQGGMRVSRPYALELAYQQEMMAPGLFLPEPRRIVQLGLGAAALTKFCYRNVPSADVVVVEAGQQPGAAGVGRLEPLEQRAEHPERVHVEDDVEDRPVAVHERNRQHPPWLLRRQRREVGKRSGDFSLGEPLQLQADGPQVVGEYHPF